MGTDYSRGLIKQVEELTLENERLRNENKAQRAEIKELRGQMEAMSAAFEASLSKLTAEIERLRGQIDKNSGNSSKPPSQDGFKRIPNSREKSARKSGGQPGHQGKRLELPENLDGLIEKGLARREIKDHTDGGHAYTSRYVIDIETVLTVTEHRYAMGQAPRGAQVYYGECIKSLVVLLCVEGVIAQERLSSFISQMTHGAIRLSDATIERFMDEMSKKLDKEMEVIKSSVLKAGVMHVDETAERCTEKPDYTGDKEGAPTMRISSGTSMSVYIRTYSTERATLYSINPQKDKEGITRDGILSRYTGILSHDHDSKFYAYGTGHATCGAHLLRELRGLSELGKVPWGNEMRLFMSAMNARKQADLAQDRESMDPTTLKEFESGYDLMLEKGRNALSALKEKQLGYDDLRRLLNRLTQYKDCYLLFIRDYRAPFTNNLAERDLRPCKTKQKVSGCFRSWQGIKIYARLRSFISSLKKRPLNLLHSFSSIFLDSPVLAMAE
jgi:hypothetical protein